MSKKQKVCSYSRVSTDNIEQLGSLESQIEDFDKIVKENKDWEYIENYVDEGITGTNVLKRKDFQRMMRDAEKGKFSLILTREVSRFARNTEDTFKYTRKLKDLGVGVWFVSDNINSLNDQDFFKLGIMALVAQEGARKTSENVKWKHKLIMNNGAVFGSNSIMGYNVKDKKLTINEEQAKVVRLIYDLYLQGKGERAIQLELMQRNIKTPLGKDRWQNTTIKRILTNEKYIGKLIQGKSITPNYLDKKRVINKDESTLIIHENTHEAIIDIDTFNKVQEEIARRAELLNVGNTRYTNKYPYSGKIKCGICGMNYKHVSWNKMVDGTKTYAWKCPERSVHGKKHDIGNGTFVGCDGVAITEVALNSLMKQVLKSLYDNRDSIFNIIENLLNKYINQDEDIVDLELIQKNIEKYKNKISSLMDLYTDGLINKSEFQLKKMNYDIEIEKQEKLLNQHSQTKKDEIGLIKKLESFKNIFKEEINFNNEKVSDEIIKRLLDYMVVHDKMNIDIHFTSGWGYNIKIDDDELIFSELQSFGIRSMY
ncbi:recombinase family protein [Desulfosporosinus sp.]|uniref:recombinase family protein n=1 Tax=Desulfosporosinus sp. TaxID=157907 RepID=UPI002603C6BF|nr:recombinase family protein [Desulfosporosinus sp.]